MGGNNFWSSARFNIIRFSTFNTFLNDFFLFVENSDLSNYADHNTLYSSGNNLEKVKQTLRQDFEIATKGFYENYMALN